jgi:SAM-dependent methyltransferase
VLGIDKERSFIRAALARRTDESGDAEFHVGDMRSLQCEGRFDAVVNWGGSFGYFSDDENLAVVRGMARALRPGGRVLIDQPNREWLLRHFQAKLGDELLKVKNRWAVSTQRMQSEWVLSSGSAAGSYRMSMRLYTPGQFKSLLGQWGLRLTHLYGSSGAESYSRTSRRIIVIGLSAPR